MYTLSSVMRMRRGCQDLLPFSICLHPFQNAEIVGRVTKVSWKRPLIEKGPYGGAHNIKGGWTHRRSYADVVVE